jgi:hypothetical protein
MEKKPEKHSKGSGKTGEKNGKNTGKSKFKLS